MRLSDFVSKQLPEDEVRHHVLVYQGRVEGNREASAMAIIQHVGGIIGQHLNKLPVQHREDALSQIVMRLLEAIERFDLSTGVKLTTYVYHHIRSGFQQAQEHLGTVRLPYSARAAGWPITHTKELDADVDAVDAHDTGEIVSGETDIGVWLGELHELQSEVAELLMQGYQQREVALIMGLSASHVKRIVRSLREEWSAAGAGVEPAPHP